MYYYIMAESSRLLKPETPTHPHIKEVRQGKKQQQVLPFTLTAYNRCKLIVVQFRGGPCVYVCACV